MDQSKLTELVTLQAREIPPLTRFCPDDRKIVAYFEGSLGERATDMLVNHLADCRHCQARLGNLARLEQNSGLQVSGDLLAEAKALVSPGERSRYRLAPIWRAAAMVVLAISLLVVLAPEIGRNANSTALEVGEHPRALRSMGSVVKPEIIRPIDGEVIEPDGLSVHWTAVEGSLHYQVRVVDELGFIIRNERIEGITEWTPRVSHLMEPGQTYYARVDAYLAGANTVSSDHVLFTVKDAQ